MKGWYSIQMRCLLVVIIVFLPVIAIAGGGVNFDKPAEFEYLAHFSKGSTVTMGVEGACKVMFWGKRRKEDKGMFPITTLVGLKTAAVTESRKADEQVHLYAIMAEGELPCRAVAN